MYQGQKVIVVLPAYRAALTLKQTYQEIPFDLVDEVVLVDDKSPDNTVEVARQLSFVRAAEALSLAINADIVIMLHPDYQYTPKLLASMITLIGNGVYPVVFGSRILGGGALKGGMPLYKYIFNRMLTLGQNLLMAEKLSEYHTGYRAFNRAVLDACPYHNCSDDFVFDNQMIAQIFWHRFEIAEITCPTKYFDEASSINFSRSMTYGFGVVHTSWRYFLARTGLMGWKLLGSRR